MEEDIQGILSVTLSKPKCQDEVEKVLGRKYIKVKVKAATTSGDASRAYFLEKFTATQSFHEYMGREGLTAFLDKCIGKVFLNCIIRTGESEISYYTDKTGKVARHCRAAKSMCNNTSAACSPASSFPPSSTPSSNVATCKHHILPEGNPIPFLVRLGIMTDKGKVVQSKYDKFKQINRFLEYVRDIINGIDGNINGNTSATGAEGRSPAREEEESPTGKGAASSANAEGIRVVDFGCGKAYLTFAIHYYLTEVLHIKSSVTGLDIKADVINYCTTVAKDLSCEGLNFLIGDIADYEGDTPDLVVALHACDTATDEALAFAVKAGSRAILSAPCCQHEVNAQLAARAHEMNASPFAPLLRYGLLRERFAALATDALRAEYLEAAGYAVDVLEFIDMEHTPKNILIRAIKRKRACARHTAESRISAMRTAAEGVITGNNALDAEASSLEAAVCPLDGATGGIINEAQARSRAQARSLSGALGVNIMLAKLLGDNR